MKATATGIVRRIDDLGRIVIPKEIRKTMRIREMDMIEIYTAGDGEIVLKKYTPIGSIAEFAKDYADSLAKVTGHCICITDMEKVVAASGNGRKEIENFHISKELEDVMNERKNVAAANTDSDYVNIVDTGRGDDTARYAYEIIWPVISDGDIMGSVIMLAKDDSEELTAEDKKIAAVAADFMGRYLA